MMTANMTKTIQTPTEPAGLISAKKAAIFLGISERLLWQLSNAKQIERVRIGRAVRYDIADLRAFIERMKSKRT